jgi:hypothetical protein
MPSSVTWRRVGFIYTDVFEQLIASIFRVGENKKILERGTSMSWWLLFIIEYFVMMTYKGVEVGL